MKRILKRFLSPSLAISAVALSLALGSGGAVMASGLIRSSQINNGAVTTPKLANGAVTPSKLAPEVCRKVIASRFRNGWHNFGHGFAVARFCKDAFGVVHLEGVITGGTADTTAFRLPTADRPRAAHAWAVAAGGSPPSLEDVNVFSTGDVFLNGTADPVALDGVSFRT